jgi:hypothetical protein
MKLSRRELLKVGLGASQLKLLEQLMPRRASAATTGGPTKLLSIWLPGGVHHEQFWCPLSDAGVAKFILPPAGNNEPYFYNAQMVRNFDGTTGDDGAFRKVRGPIWWNPANPADALTTPNPASGGVQKYIPAGYSWASRDFSPTAVCERTCVVHGIDQGTAAHGSGVVASMCGVAGGNFRAPAIAAVVANAMMKRFPDRPLPSVSIMGMLNPVAVSTDAHPLSGATQPTYLTSVDSLAFTVSDYPDNAWRGFRARSDVPELSFGGSATGRTLPLTAIDRKVLEATRAMRGRSTAATDAVFQQLYESYGAVSRTLARDVVRILENTPGAEKLPLTIPWAPITRRFGYIVGYADGGSTTDWDPSFDLVLRLLKSDLATSITLPVFGAEMFAFDTHSPPASLPHVNHLRGTLEVIGRLLIEMQLTPSPSQPGKTLLDETLVHIWSDFGRTFFRANSGTDHHPTTSVVLVGGNVHGNRMIGGYDETATGSPLGAPVGLLDLESGTRARSVAMPRAADLAATIYRCFGLEAGRDYFIPGGYAEVEGVLDA